MSGQKNGGSDLVKAAACKISARIFSALRRLFLFCRRAAVIVDVKTLYLFEGTVFCIRQSDLENPN